MILVMVFSQIIESPTDQTPGREKRFFQRSKYVAPDIHLNAQRRLTHKMKLITQVSHPQSIETSPSAFMFRCLNTSYMVTPPATEAFNESTLPNKGIETK